MVDSSLSLAKGGKCRRGSKELHRRGIVDCGLDHGGGLAVDGTWEGHRGELRR